MAPKSIATLPLLLVGALLFVRCQSPARSGPGSIVVAAARHGLIDIRTVVPDVVVDLRYATAGNVARRALYPADMPCLIERRTGNQLAQAAREVASHGYRLKIWDAYRPPQSHLALWRAVPNGNYVSAPSKTLSMHCAGAAVDLTLVDANGRELKMPTGFDHFSPAAAAEYQGGDPEVARNVAVLQQAMRRAGFSTMKTEWWHFWNPSATPHVAVPADALGIVLPPHVRSIPPRSR
ncbi:MAG: M15 family metallopeptidase [Verrucomicrobia bacterium]|nr:M15 family metallopeptidase [Verrucomicrobiota bacterium]